VLCPQMAHGNLSDVVFLALVGIATQWLAFPDTLYQDIGAVKAQFTAKGKDIDLVLAVGASLLVFIGTVFSGVKWNKMNGKVTGLFSFIAAGSSAYSTFKSDGDTFVPRFLYLYCFVLFLGGLAVFALYSNPMPPKTPQTKNNHGNFADTIALGLFLVSMSWFFFPDHLFQDFGPVKAQFSSKSPDLFAMIRLVAGLLLVAAGMLFGVKWNPINGKLSGLGALGAAGYSARAALQADSGRFVPRLVYFYAALLLLGAVHLMFFPSNPVPPKPGAKQE